MVADCCFVVGLKIHSGRFAVAAGCYRHQSWELQIDHSMLEEVLWVEEGEVGVLVVEMGLCWVSGVWVREPQLALHC